MNGKWMLFIPFFRSAYIGAISCVSAEEQELKADNYSVWMVSLDVAIAVALWVTAMHPGVIMYLFLGFTLFFRWLLSVVSSYYMLRLTSKHPGLLSVFSAFPFVLFGQSLRLEI